VRVNLPLMHSSRWSATRCSPSITIQLANASTVIASLAHAQLEISLAWLAQEAEGGATQLIGPRSFGAPSRSIKKSA